MTIEPLENRRLLATYYVDAQGGDDSLAGTDPSQAWASLTKIEQTPLAAGDQVLLKNGSRWNDGLSVSRSGTAANPIRFGTYGTGESPQLFQLYVSGSHTIFDGLTVDHQKQAGDAVRVKGGKEVVLRNMEVRNGLQDGIDMHNADGVLIENLYIHHFLAGSFTLQADAHGIVATDTQGLTIRDTQIHHVSGDSFQTDPDRDTDISTDILIERSHFWTSPLDVDFNESWLAGQRPGENAIDTKVVKENWDQVPRMRITLRDVTAHGWLPDSYINNKAAFNMKENIEAVFEGVTVYDSEIAFRLRGSRGNANVTIENAVIYDVDKAIRAEDNLANLVFHNSTFGNGIGTMLQFAGGDAGTGTWDIRNNAFVGSKPGVASDASNRVAVNSDFIDAAGRDYRLSTNSTLLDTGTTLVSVAIDRDGHSRSQGSGYDVGAFELQTSQQSEVIAEDDSLSIQEDSSASLDVLANDSSLSGQPLTITAVSAGSQGGTLAILDGGSISYRPAANFYGEESFTYTITDGSVGGEATATVVVSVTAVNDPPAANDDRFSVEAGSTGNLLGVLANDSIVPDRDESLTIAAVSVGSAGGAISIEAGQQIRYTPAAGFSGEETFTYTIHDGSSGSTDTATVTVAVSAQNAPSDPEAIDFHQYRVGSYDESHDISATASIEDGGATLHITGNGWKQISFPYQVTADTILEFDFRSPVEGDIQGIGFDTNLRLSKEYGFTFYGTQNWGSHAYRDYAQSAPEWKHYRIPVGQFYTGSFEYLYFANDHDVSNANAEVYFRNVKVYQEGSASDSVVASASTATYDADSGSDSFYASAFPISTEDDRFDTSAAAARDAEQHALPVPAEAVLKRDAGARGMRTQAANDLVLSEDADAELRSEAELWTRGVDEFFGGDAMEDLLLS